VKKILLLIVMLVTVAVADIYKVVKVIDGDTINVIDNNNTVYKIRLAYIDTMESRYNNRLKKIETKCNIDKYELLKLGKESSNFIKLLVPVNSYVKIDILGIDNTKTRYVGVVYKHNSLLNYSDSITVNETMVSYGYAIPYTKYIKYYNVSLLDYYNELFNTGVSKNNTILNNECVINTLLK